jgi:hypothetical protein
MGTSKYAGPCAGGECSLPGRSHSPGEREPNAGPAFFRVPARAQNYTVADERGPVMPGQRGRSRAAAHRLNGPRSPTKRLLARPLQRPTAAAHGRGLAGLVDQGFKS